jgi:hypothetical protein
VRFFFVGRDGYCRVVIDCPPFPLSDRHDALHEPFKVDRLEDAPLTAHVDREVLVGVFVDHDRVVAQVEVE